MKKWVAAENFESLFLAVNVTITTKQSVPMKSTDLKVPIGDFENKLMTIFLTLKIFPFVLKPNFDKVFPNFPTFSKRFYIELFITVSMIYVTCLTVADHIVKIRFKVLNRHYRRHRELFRTWKYDKPIHWPRIYSPKYQKLL